MGPGTGVVGTATRSCVCKSRVESVANHRGPREPIYRASPNRLFIDRTRLSTRLISVKNVTISRAPPSTSENEIIYVRTADANSRRIIDCCLPKLSLPSPHSLSLSLSPSFLLLLLSACFSARQDRRSDVYRRIDFNRSLTAFASD